VGRFWSHARQRVGNISNFIREQNNFTDTDAFGFLLVYNYFLKHKQANINVKSRRFGIIMTPFSRQSEQM